MLNLDFKNFSDEFLEQKLLNQQIEFFKKEIEKKDEEFFHSEERKAKKYVPHGFFSRTIFTTFGKITYKRRLYRVRENGKTSYFYPADQFFNVEKKKRIHESLRNQIIAKMGTAKRYQDICDEFKNVKFSHFAIYDIFKNAKINGLKKK